MKASYKLELEQQQRRLRLSHNQLNRLDRKHNDINLIKHLQSLQPKAASAPSASITSFTFVGGDIYGGGGWTEDPVDSGIYYAAYEGGEERSIQFTPIFTGDGTAVITYSGLFTSGPPQTMSSTAPYVYWDEDVEIDLTSVVSGVSYNGFILMDYPTNVENFRMIFVLTVSGGASSTIILDVGFA
jgi:hypothetical protein